MSIESAKSAESVTINLSNEGVMNPIEQEVSSGGWFPAAHQLVSPVKTELAREWLGKRKAGLRNWREFFKTDKFYVPTSPTVAMHRIGRNVEFFLSNYCCFVALLLVYSIVTSPVLLLALAAFLGLCYLVSIRNVAGPVKFGSLELNLTAQYILVGLFCTPLFYVAGAGGLLFWVIGASFCMILMHATFYASEEIPGAEFETIRQV